MAEYTAIALLLVASTFFIIYAAIHVKHMMVQLALSLLSLYMMAFNFFMGSVLVIGIDATSTNLEQLLLTYYQIFLYLANFALAGGIIFLLYYTFRRIYTLKRKQRGLEEEDIYD